MQRRRYCVDSRPGWKAELTTEKMNSMMSPTFVGGSQIGGGKATGGSFQSLRSWFFNVIAIKTYTSFSSETFFCSLPFFSSNKKSHFFTKS